MQKVKISLLCMALLLQLNRVLPQGGKGIFEGGTDVGNIQLKGSLTYNNALQQYGITGSGNNIWFNHDAFYYAWRQLTGDFILQARVSWVGKGKEAHRKAGWMVRTTLDSTSAMVCGAVHGDGLAALQYRTAATANIEEQRMTVKAPDVLQLERKGNKFILSAAVFGEPFDTIAVSDVQLGEKVYAGLFVCAHNAQVTEKAQFSNVRIIVPAPDSLLAYKQYLGSHIELLDVHSGNRKIIYTDSTTSLQAPNWTHDGKALLYNSKGLIYHFDLATKKIEPLNTGAVKQNNNDHVLSFDGRWLGLSSNGNNAVSGSLVFTVPVTGGEPKQITPVGPSYLHGWSPDGKTLLFTGQRKGDFDIYSVPAAGGEEKQLTNTPGLDDGSEYSPDGQYIYFNSVRSGTMQLWRMRPDGSGQTQLTDDGFNNWFPHVSPDGKQIVFLSFNKDVAPGDHPFYKRVYIRVMPVSGGAPKVLAYVYGGQGSMNTPGWSPDSRHIAFVSNSGRLQ
ncbi:TolB family protein [Deminuibacter soli]|uniref:Biopolymer transporter TolR n=1 Tax=Deminuibacter soli TaxID=2291815 RepID=A0A3E1NQU7_9BACT|nr:PD40 domain-containing protein [Deminuibacter soli]RFM30302.1 biopolymer transporter TolR [Deminuibacter soli]